MHMLGVIENHMLVWGVAEKRRCCCQLALKLQKEKKLVDNEPNNYDWNYKGQTP
jgi:hypothetical protein